MNPSSTHPPSLAAIYRRVSTDHQENSLLVQETLNDEYARRMALPALTAFEDEDVSGSIPFLERTGGRALLNRLKLGDITDVITAKQDRLGRDTQDSIQTIRTIWSLGIVPHFTCEGGALPRTPQNELLFEIKASVAQYERNLIVERTKAVMRHKFNKNELTGNIPYGFDCTYTFADNSTAVAETAYSAAELAALEAKYGAVVSKRLTPNPEEQINIRLMKQLRDQHTPVPGGIGQLVPTSYTAIAEQMNHRGLRTKQGKPWGCGNVRSVLTSRHTQRLLSVGS